MNFPASQKPPPNSGEEASLLLQYQSARQQSLKILAPLEVEDTIIQSMPDVSPPKWHLAHTSWFFETFILEKAFSQYPVFHPKFNYLFNSYYKAIGEHHPRPQRGFLSRPTLSEVLAYRKHVDEWMQKLLESSQAKEFEKFVVLGCQHEQQHQELLLTDIKHIFFTNPLRPTYQATPIASLQNTPELKWKNYSEGLIEIGHAEDGFAYDNESPRHKAWLEPFSLASRLVTNGEYLEFIQDGTYEKPGPWLSDAWDWILKEDRKMPLYWEKQEDGYWQMTLSGMQPLKLEEPVCHVSYYEADAFARWAGKRLPTEVEWEHAASQVSQQGNFYDTGKLHPSVAITSSQDEPVQLFGDVWEWTQSPYTPYPGFQPLIGAAGEYNGKFMCNQMVLRGGSCLSSANHLRVTYRNFFPPESQWQCTGIRLAQNH